MCMCRGGVRWMELRFGASAHAPQLPTVRLLRCAATASRCHVELPPPLRGTTMSPADSCLQNVKTGLLGTTRPAEPAAVVVQAGQDAVPRLILAKLLHVLPARLGQGHVVAAGRGGAGKECAVHAQQSCRHAAGHCNVVGCGSGAGGRCRMAWGMAGGHAVWRAQAPCLPVHVGSKVDKSAHGLNACCVLKTAARSFGYAAVPSGVGSTPMPVCPDTLDMQARRVNVRHSLEAPDPHAQEVCHLAGRWVGGMGVRKRTGAGDARPEGAMGGCRDGPDGPPVQQPSHRWHASPPPSRTPQTAWTPRRRHG